MPKGKGKQSLSKEENAEDWCFECKDGGELRVCDYKHCLKSYHPECIGKDDSFLTSDKPWTCRWHKCLVCKNKPNYHCYCCVRAVCSRCIGCVEFVLIKGKYGFCNNCLKLAVLVEEDVTVDSDGENVDLKDRETYEGLFKEYYEIIKEQQGFDSNSILAAKVQMDKGTISIISSDSDDEPFEVNEELDLVDREPHEQGLKKKSCTQQKAKMTQRRVKSKKKEFFGWGSKALIDFLHSIGQDTREKISQHEVTSIITKYVKEHNLTHPDKKRRIVCDARLRTVFGKKEVNRHRIYNLLESHFVENQEQSEKEELDHDDLEDNDVEMLAAPKRESKFAHNRISSIRYSPTVKSEFAALILENIRLVYLKRSLVLEMIKQPQPFENKLIGSFVRVKLDPSDYKRSSSHQLVQIEGVKHGSTDKYYTEISLQVSNMPGDVCLTMLSDDDFSKEECEDLREKVKAGLLKRLTVVELEQKAKILHEDITKHRIARDLDLLQKLIDRANEKGWRRDLFGYLEKRKLLQQPTYLSFSLQNIPGVIAEEIEVEPMSKVEKDGNQIHQSSEVTTSTEVVECEQENGATSTEKKQNVPGVIPDEVEPLAEDERDGNQMHQCSKETTPSEVVECALSKVDNQMHQCSEETNPYRSCGM